MLDPQGAAGILPKSSDERTQEEGRGFSTIKISEPNEAIPLDVVSTCICPRISPASRSRSSFQTLSPGSLVAAIPTRCHGRSKCSRRRSSGLTKLPVTGPPLPRSPLSVLAPVRWRRRTPSPNQATDTFADREHGPPHGCAIHRLRRRLAPHRSGSSSQCRRRSSMAATVGHSRVRVAGVEHQDASIRSLGRFAPSPPIRRGRPNYR